MRARWKHGGQLLAHPVGLKMLPGGTPASFVAAAKLRCKRLAVRTGRPAHDAVLLVAGEPGCGLPCSVVGHRPFDTEDAAVVVVDDEVE